MEAREFHKFGRGRKINLQGKGHRDGRQARKQVNGSYD